jgi:hypothetical protein
MCYGVPLDWELSSIAYYSDILCFFWYGSWEMLRGKDQRQLSVMPR